MVANELMNNGHMELMVERDITNHWSYKKAKYHGVMVSILVGVI